MSALPAAITTAIRAQLTRPVHNVDFRKV